MSPQVLQSSRVAPPRVVPELAGTLRLFNCLQRAQEGVELLSLAVLLASMNGYAPQVAVEFGRKVLFAADRPGFAELEEAIKSKK